MNHEQLAQENFKRARLGGEIEGQHPGLEWRVTVFFYAALHAVTHAILASNPNARLDHSQRRQIVLLQPQFAGIRRSYGALEAMSQKARYKPETHPFVVDEYKVARAHALAVMTGVGVAVPK